MTELLELLRAALAKTPGITDDLCRSDVENYVGVAIWSLELGVEHCST